MKKFLLLLLLTGLMWQTRAQSLINAGPMIGHTDMTEVTLWIQTTRPANVKFTYWLHGADLVRAHSTETCRTTKENAYVCKIKIKDLKPGTAYDYAVVINGKRQKFPYKLTFKTQELWRWHKAPSDFSFVFGSGAYTNDPMWDRPGSPYGGHYRIYESIADQKPDFMIWGGDNIYLRQGEWNSRDRIIYRYTHDRHTPELQRLLGTVAHYAILDDHDFGPNDSDGSFWNKNTTIEVFRLFWANPSVGVGNLKGAISMFSWNDADFFLLDNRYYRDANDLKTKRPKTMLGKEQLEWLKNALAKSRARFKFIVMGGQFLNTARRFETYSNHGFAAERQEIIDFILDQDVRNVIFLTGDRHESEISVYNPGNGQPAIFDLTSSPFTSGPNTHAAKEVNMLRIPGSVIMQRNFARVDVKGQGKDRHVEVSYYDTDGKLIYSYRLDFNNPVPQVKRKTEALLPNH